MTINHLHQNKSIVKKFPEEFINSSLVWIRSWFLVDDIEHKSSSDDFVNIKNQENLIQTKLQTLLKDEKFVKELNSFLNTASKFENRSKNIADNLDVKTKDEIIIGDKLIKVEGDFTNKNVVKDSSFESKEGGFRLGDDFE
ncbi:MAG: hypothetical protein R3D00_05300 [Bacteroidia bacterium]